MTIAELVDGLPEFIFDCRRTVLWQLDDADAMYGLVASGGLVGQSRRSLSDLRRLTDTALVPLCIDRRPRDEGTGLLADTTQSGGAIDLDVLSKAVAAQLDRLGIARSDWARVAKVGEEGGEVVGALIKREECRTSTADVLDELGDVILAALAACDQLGVAPSTVIAERWAAVSQRSPEAFNGAVVGEGR
jgi:phosphoribosyl-ATP pyrophosphohydrolase